MLHKSSSIVSAAEVNLFFFFFFNVLELDNAFSSLFTTLVTGKEIPEDSEVLCLVGGNIFIGFIFYCAILQLDDMRN